MRVSLSATVLLLGAFIGACQGGASSAGSELPRLHALPEFTVSGVSAGAYLAMQMHVAYSHEMVGAGLVASGPWGCANGSIQQALGACMSGTGIDVVPLVQKAAELAEQNRIDPLSDLAGDNVFLFRGAADVVLGAGVSRAAADWYRLAAPDTDLLVVNDIPATHGWPTPANGAPCGEFREPWINACDYDLAGAMLQHLLGPLQAPASPPLPLRRFNQEPFKASSMADEGLLFVPPACEGGQRCRVHVFLHGCKQAEGQIGSILAEQSGLLSWATSNDLIVLFPQATSSRIAPMNPLACWDWWGYSGSDYLAQDAPQLKAIRAMIARLQESG